MLPFVTASENLPFTAALCLMLVIGFLEGVFTLLGMGFSHFFDTLHPGHGGGLPHGADGHQGLDLDQASSPLLRFLDWLHVGKVPILIVFVVSLTVFGLVGLGIQLAAANLVHRLLPALLAAAPTVVISLPLVRCSTGLLSRILPKDESEAVSEESFVGRVATVTLGSARRGHPAQAKLRDQFGQTHYMQVEPDLEEEVFTTGTAVLIVRRAGAIFRGIRNTAPALLD